MARQPRKTAKDTRELTFNSQLKVGFGVLGAANSLIADDYAGPAPSDNKTRKVYALCSITSINGEAVSPLSSFDEFQQVLEQFEGAAGLQYLKQLIIDFLAFSQEAAEAASAAVPAE